MSKLPCTTAQSHKGLFRSQNTSVMYMNVAGKSLTFGSRTIIISCGSSFEHPCMRTVLGIRLCEPLYGNTDNLNLCAENTQLSLETSDQSFAVCLKIVTGKDQCFQYQASILLWATISLLAKHCLNSVSLACPILSTCICSLGPRPWGGALLYSTCIRSAHNYC